MDRLHEIKIPTLVIAGRHDFLFPPEHQAILTDRLPNAQLEIIERAGHNPHLERTSEVLVIDGGPATRFTRRLVELIETAYGLAGAPHVPAAAGVEAPADGAVPVPAEA
jgi:pimeloyl-ACP methyl ester carboxylesterase